MLAVIATVNLAQHCCVEPDALENSPLFTGRLRSLPLSVGPSSCFAFLRLPISRSRPGDFCPRCSYRKTLFERVLDAFPRAGVEGEKDRTKLKDPEHPYRRNAIECLGALVKFFPLNVAPR